MTPEAINKLLTSVAYDERATVMATFADMDCSFTDAKGQNVLFPAIAKQRGLTAFFLDRGARMDQQNIDGNTPLHLAAANMDIEAARILLERGAAVGLQNKFGNQVLWAALMEAIKVVNLPQGYELLEMILKRGADRDHRNHAGMTPRFFVERNVDDPRIREMFLT
jgi:uncharacterized protein